MAVNKKVFELTKEGLEEKEREYRNLIDVERPKVIEDLQNARAMGDLSENADYDAARNKQAQIEERIKVLEAILNNYVIIEATKTKTIQVSSVVTFKDLEDGSTHKVKIVSSIESDPVSDPKNVKISNVCALGEALIGHKPGETVRVKVANPYDVEIISLE